MLPPIVLQKKYGKFIMVRDAQVEKHIKMNVPMTIIHQNDRMTLTPMQLHNGRKIIKKIDSKFSGERAFELVSYAWVPDTGNKPKVPNTQLTLDI